MTTTALEARIRPSTRRLIEDAHRFSPFYGGYLANHLPMALIALDRLGADDAQVEAFARRYARKLEPLPAPGDRIAEADHARFLGRRDAVASWIAFFEGELARDGAEAVLSRWVVRLMPGVGSTAFHGAIRLSYALESGSGRELAHALGQWAADLEPLGAPAAVAGAASPAEALASLNGDPRFTRRRYAGGSIAARMARAAADPEAAALIASVDPRKLDVRGQARALLGAYAATGDFTVLHGVAACLAVRTLLPYAKDPAAARGHLWRALACAYLSAGGPAAGAPLRGDEGLSWPEIQARAADSRDEHDIKLAYACRREWEDGGGDLYRRAASATLAPR